MNTLEINKTILPHQRDTIFQGVYACDALPKRVKTPSAYIINLSPKHESGTHWIGLFINSAGDAYYFDSFGIPPRNKYIKFFIRMHSKKLIYNEKQVQHLTSNKCGKFCCAFIISILKNRPIQHFLKKFSTNLMVNEIIIENIFRYFNS